MTSFVYDDDDSDQDGKIDLAFANNDEERQRKNVLAMLKSNGYGLKPEAAGQLDELLGAVDPEMAQEEARRRVRRALDTMGLPDVRVDAVAGSLDQQWRLALNVGD